VGWGEGNGGVEEHEGEVKFEGNGPPAGAARVGGKPGPEYVGGPSEEEGFVEEKARAGVPSDRFRGAAGGVFPSGGMTPVVSDVEGEKDMDPKGDEGERPESMSEAVGGRAGPAEGLGKNVSEGGEVG